LFNIILQRLLNN